LLDNRVDKQLPKKNLFVIVKERAWLSFTWRQCGDIECLWRNFLGREKIVSNLKLTSFCSLIVTIMQLQYNKLLESR